MIIADAHQDIAFNAVYFGRDYRQSALVARAREAGNPLPIGTAMLGLPDALLGRVAVVFGSVLPVPVGAVRGVEGYGNAREAHRMAQQQADVYGRLADNCDNVRLIRTRADLDGVLATWVPDSPIGERRQGLVMALRNGDCILEPRQFEAWYERGVRVVAPVWKMAQQGTYYQGGRLTAAGRDLLNVLASYAVLLDVSAMAATAYQEALDSYPGAVMAVGNPAHFGDSERHFVDRQLRLLAERDGVLAIVPQNSALERGWRTGDAAVPLTRLVDTIDRVCQLTGNAMHVALGSRFDSGVGAEGAPQGLDTVGDLWTLGAALRARGYGEAEVEAVLGGNLLSRLRGALPER